MLTHLLAYLQARLDLREERGATAVEYGILVALIAGAIITAVGVLGDDLVATFEGIDIP